MIRWAYITVSLHFSFMDTGSNSFYAYVNQMLGWLSPAGIWPCKIRALNRV